MANIKWSGYFIYKAEHKDIGSVLKGSFIPVSYFSVKGGAMRNIDLNGTDDISLVSEFEQARTFKNISLHLPPTKSFEWLDLTEIFVHRLRFTVVFFVQGKIDKTLTHEFTISSKTAQISESPVKKFVTGKGNVLKVSIALPETILSYTSPQGLENW